MAVRRKEQAVCKIRTSCQLEKSLLEAIDRTANEEHRNRNNMMVVLLLEALAARGESVGKSSDHDEPSDSGRSVAGCGDPSQVN